MVTRRRRRWGWVATVALSIGAGLAALVAAAAGDSERVAAIWISAEVLDTGSGETIGGQAEVGRADITEVIDYDFGAESRRGIFRDVPDLPIFIDAAGRPTATVEVSSPTAPDQFVIEPFSDATRIRIGDPDVTINGRHRYTITYPLIGATDNGRFSYDAIGTFWEVGFEDVEVHVVAPFELLAPTCDRGSTGDVGGCDVDEVEPGHLLVEIDSLGAGEGVTIGAELGAPLISAPSPPTAPTGPASDPGDGLARPALLAVLATLLGTFPAVYVTRRAGREQAAVGGPADIAYAEHVIASDPSTVQLVDAADLSQLATIEFAPPAGVQAAQGGVVLHERVRAEHSTAWLLNQAIFGAVDLDLDGRDPVIRRTGVPAPLASDESILAAMFGGRSEVTLKKYDKTFAAGWKRVGASLEKWMETSSLWSTEARSRRTRWAALAALVTVVGLLVGLAGAALASRYGGPWIAAVPVGFAAAGFGLGLVIRSWELLVRTPRGTATWIRLLSFKRFLAGSETQHVEWAAQHGMLREYTAWAVALDEADHWARALERSNVDETSQTAAHDAVRFATIAPALSRATQAASTAPSSSGGGGGVGGGAGGGGGGSW